MSKKILFFIPFLIFYLVSFIQRTAFPGTVFDMLQSDFGAGAAALTGVGASFAYVYGITQFFAGSWAERLGGGRLGSEAELIDQSRPAPYIVFDHRLQQKRIHLVLRKLCRLIK